MVDTFDAIPYIVGESFVKAVYAALGNSGVDRAFLARPTTSLQLLHPRQWLAGLLPTPPRPPWPALGPGTLAYRGVLGVLGLWLTVDSAHPDIKAASALDGWAGDAYVSTSGSGGTACFVDLAHFTGTGARDRAVAFLRPWLTGENVHAVLVGTTYLRLDACQG